MRNKRKLYESIMKDVSKTIKKHLNESDTYPIKISQRLAETNSYNVNDIKKFIKLGGEVHYTYSLKDYENDNYYDMLSKQSLLKLLLKADRDPMNHDEFVEEYEDDNYYKTDPISFGITFKWRDYQFYNDETDEEDGGYPLIIIDKTKTYK